MDTTSGGVGRGGGGDGMSIRDEATVGLRCVPEKGKGPSYVHARRIRAGERWGTCTHAPGSEGGGMSGGHSVEACRGPVKPG